MKKTFFSALFVFFLLAGTMMFAQHKSFAQNENFNAVQLIITATGRMAFFDQSNGKIYIYDTDGENCTYIGKLQTLGQPIKPLKLTNPTDAYKVRSETKPQK